MPTSSSNPSELIDQISKNLSNTLSTFGPQSPQYIAVLETLRICIRDVEANAEAASKARSHRLANRGEGGGGSSNDGDEDGDNLVEELRELLEWGLNVSG